MVTPSPKLDGRTLLVACDKVVKRPEQSKFRRAVGFVESEMQSKNGSEKKRSCEKEARDEISSAPSTAGCF
jgi:hypothetical protein